MQVKRSPVLSSVSPSVIAVAIAASKNLLCTMSFQSRDLEF